jgi:hypothetical protein
MLSTNESNQPPRAAMPTSGHDTGLASPASEPLADADSVYPIVYRIGRSSRSACARISTRTMIGSRKSQPSRKSLADARAIYREWRRSS